MGSSDASGSADNDPGRQESLEERADRNLTELLQELRVAGLGIQVLFGFLLSLPFTNRFQKLDATQRGLYLVAVLLAVASIVLLTAPVAYHRILFRRHRKEWLVRAGSRTAIAGLACVAAAVSSSVALITSFVAPGPLAAATAAVVPSVFLGLWFILPIASRPSERADWDLAQDRLEGGRKGVSKYENVLGKRKKSVLRGIYGQGLIMAQEPNFLFSYNAT